MDNAEDHIRAQRQQNMEKRAKIYQQLSGDNKLIIALSRENSDVFWSYHDN